MRRKCGCCGVKPTKPSKIMARLGKVRDVSKMPAEEIGMSKIKAPAGQKDIDICLVCWGEIMKAFGRMVRETYIPDAFYYVAVSIIAARKESL